MISNHNKVIILLILLLLLSFGVGIFAKETQQGLAFTAANLLNWLKVFIIFLGIPVLAGSLLYVYVVKVLPRKKEAAQKELQQEKGIEQPRLATLQERISAYIIDLALFWLPLGAMLLITPVITEGKFSIVNLIPQRLNPLLVVLFVYGGFLTGKYGWTLGKRYIGTKVVITKTFQKVSFGRAFLREAIKFGVHLIPYLFALNIIVILKSPKNQAIHDMIAKTQVIKSGSGECKKLLNIIFIIFGTLFFISLILFVKYR